MICFQISIFEPLETTNIALASKQGSLWFAFKLVSLNHWKQLFFRIGKPKIVVICFQISIFEPLETTRYPNGDTREVLWFAFKLVSLNHWKQPNVQGMYRARVVICFQISIFEPLETTRSLPCPSVQELWFAFKLVSLNHWKQHPWRKWTTNRVVICFQISIFEPLETTQMQIKQSKTGCDLLSN